MLGFAEAGDASAPPLVLLHSLATSRALWQFQMPLWALRHRVIAFDLPGHGASPASKTPGSITDMADHVAACCKMLGVHSASIVGLSLGSMIAQVLAARQPDTVSRLVLSNGVAVTPPDLVPLWHERAEQARDHGMAAQIDSTLARWFTPTFRASSPTTMEWVGGMIAGTSVAGYGHACEAISRLDNASALPTIGCPTLVIAGSEDGAAPPAALEGMARAIPSAQFATLPAAHLANVEAPTAYAELVGSFLDDTND